MDTRSVARRGIDFVLAVLRSRDFRVREVPASRRNEVQVLRAYGRPLNVRIKTRTGGTWQGTTNDADPDPVRNDSRFVVFVDLAGHQPEYYVVPEWWFQQDVHRELEDYLARHPSPPASTHHAIPLQRIKQWHERWDLLGVAES